MQAAALKITHELFYPSSLLLTISNFSIPIWLMEVTT
jgi:hypothetical protein